MKRLSLLLIGLLFSFIIIAQNSPKMNYTEVWKKIEDLTNRRQPQSALEEIQKVYDFALKEKNYTHVIKATIYRINNLAIVEENTTAVLIESLKRDAELIPQPDQSVIYSILGDLYKGYYQANRWRIQGRTSVAVDDDDINTWDISRLFKESLKYYKLSIENEKILQQASIDNYADILGNSRQIILPTLYDFLVFRAINAFAGEMGVISPQQKFVLNAPEYFSDVKEFVKYNIETSDSTSIDYLTISLYQKLLKFRLNQLDNNIVKSSKVNNIYALINIDIDRLNYVRKNGKYSNNDVIYEAALKSLMNKYAETEEWTYPTYALAVLYNTQGEDWRASKNDNLRFKFKEAYALCSQIIEKYPNSNLNSYANQLQKEITSPSVQFKAQNQQYPNSPILALAKYRNLNKAYLFTYKVDEKYLDKLKEEYRNDDVRLSDFVDKVPVKKQEIELASQSDYQYYSSEVKLDELAQGFYVLFITDKPELPKKDDNTYYDRPLAKTILQVSPLSVVIRSGDNKMSSDLANKVPTFTQVYLMDSKTGEPVQKAKVDYYTQNWQSGKSGEPGKYLEIFEGSFYTDDKGLAYIPSKDNNYNNKFKKVIVTHKTERLVVYNWSNGYWRRGNNQKQNQVVFFTDRSIYRPGQTVYYKALYLKTDADDNNHLIPNSSLNVDFKDVNYKSIGNQTHTTNEYGTIQGSFVIPQGLLNGSMTLQTTYGAISIQVEEYKRPTFEVKFDAVKKNYKLNDNVEVSGSAKALAGYAIDNSKVQYRVVRNIQYRFYRWWYPQVSQPEREIASGEAETNSKGEFQINFKAEADDVKNNDLIYNYTITADITDVNGETRSATLSVKVGKNPLLVVTNIPESIVDRNSLLFDLTTTNLNGDNTPADVTLKVTALNAPAGILRNRLWEAPDTLSMSRDTFKKYFPIDAYGDESNPNNYTKGKQVASINSKTSEKGQKKIDLKDLANIPAGWYRIDINAKNADGVEVNDVQFVQLVSAAKSKPSPIKTMGNWVTAIKSTGEPNEIAEFLVAGGEQKSYVYYEILHKDKIIDKKTLIVGTTPERITIPIKEEYRGGFIVQFIMVQNGRVYHSFNTINVPYSNKNLDIKFTTFRDKLLPGEQEKWTLTVKNKQGEKEMAEMVATLYDASLDVFRPHSWDGASRFYPQRNNYYKFQWGVPEYEQIKVTSYGDYEEYNASLFYPQYPYLDMLGSNYTRAFYNRGVSTKSINQSAKSMASAVMEVSGEGVLEESVVVGFAAAKPESKMKDSAFQDGIVEQAESGGGAVPEVQQLDEIATRQNFNETAFFYPQLKTNEEGEIIIEFTIPEALTRWKMLGFAHTKDFKVGSTTNELITQKQVAISANAPRFFRENDVIEFTAKVNNITEQALSGQAMLRLYDATNMQPIDATVLKSAQMQSFKVNAGESAGLKWTLAIPVGVQAITYKVTAQAGNHTDGEEKIVPVMPNSMLVTETMPFSIRAGQQKDFTFTRLKNNKSNTLRNHRLTLEFTSNPAWYAIQAMPYLMEYPYECAEQVFSRFYANSLATTVVNSSPRIKQVFDMWRNNPENKDALLSNLEKNEELKQVLLEETPWVMQAENETERKKRVGLLFDLNRMSGELQHAFSKLKKAQSSNGGFPWFEGLPEDRYMTQHIIKGVEHLRKLNALGTEYATDAQNMVTNGLAYLDYTIKDDYDKLLKIKNVDLSKQHISSIQLHYLYTCSFSEHKPYGEEQQKAFDYYFKQAAEYWMNFNLFNQAAIALTMKRYGNNEVAATIMKSLKERALQSEEMGMYWKDNVAGYFWYQAPIETQALLIEAFNEVANDSQSVEEMKIWLLRNKQTNDWRTTKATAEACYALLKTGGNLLDESRIIDVKIAGKPLNEIAKEDIRPEPGTGYVKTAWSGSDITKNMADLSVSNPNKSGIAWGGVYWQYFEQLDKITSAETNLRMNKQLFLKKNTERGPELLPINSKNTLKVGDLVTVRMELRADRDYEFVHLKDMRAAGFEPTKTISGYRYQDGLWYYENIKDASTNFFISYLRKGTYVFEYELRVTHSGEFSNGITTFQCMYAPEFSAHSEGIRVKIE